MDSWVSSRTIEEYFGRMIEFDFTVTSSALDEIRAGKWKAFPIPLVVFNPETQKAQKVFVNVLDFLVECSHLFYAMDSIKKVRTF